MQEQEFKKIESKIRKAIKNGKLALTLGRKKWYNFKLIITEYAFQHGFIIDVYTKDDIEHLGRVCITNVELRGEKCQYV